MRLRAQDQSEIDKMCFFFSFMPATFWTIVGYFILFSTTKAEGRIKTLGQVLAIWAFIIAGFILLAGAYITFAGLCSFDAAMACFR
jgi:uncharacterized membrane protein (DUF485 family)